MASGRGLLARGRRGRRRGGARGRLQPPRQALARDDHPLPQPRAELRVVARAGRSGVEHERHAAPVREVLPRAGPHRRPGRGRRRRPLPRAGDCRIRAEGLRWRVGHGLAGLQPVRRCRRARARARSRPRPRPRGPALRDHELDVVVAVPQQPTARPVPLPAREHRRCPRRGAPVWRPRQAAGPALLLEVSAATGSGRGERRVEPGVRGRRAPPLAEHRVAGPEHRRDRPRARRLPHHARGRSVLARARQPGEGPDVRGLQLRAAPDRLVLLHALVVRRGRPHGWAHDRVGEPHRRLPTAVGPDGGADRPA